MNSDKQSWFCITGPNINDLRVAVDINVDLAVGDRVEFDSMNCHDWSCREGDRSITGRGTVVRISHTFAEDSWDCDFVVVCEELEVDNNVSVDDNAACPTPSPGR